MALENVMHERALLDTGPLVALLAADDASHEICASQSRELASPLITTWPVLTEAAWLLRGKPESIPRMLGLLVQGLVECAELGAAAAPAITALARTYADIRPQLADLSLVYLADRDQVETVFTLDRRDFAIYRDQRGNPFRLVP